MVVSGQVTIILASDWPSDANTPGYSIVCPSIPGMGFSGKPSTTGTSPAVIACMYHQVMIRLGYLTYVVSVSQYRHIPIPPYILNYIPKLVLVSEKSEAIFPIFTVV